MEVLQDSRVQPPQGPEGHFRRPARAALQAYEGYVKNTNLLREQIADMMARARVESPIFAELVRRLPFEQNGMVLHEHYFDNMIPTGGRRAEGRRAQQGHRRELRVLDAYKKELMARPRCAASAGS
jgi:superoxide dismutase